MTGKSVLLFFFLLLSAILVYTFFFATGGRVDLHYPVEESHVCGESQTRPCQVGNCTGISTCKGGSWDGCRLEMVCEPGSRIACIEEGCAKGFRECDECGTGYGPCQ